MTPLSAAHLVVRRTVCNLHPTTTRRIGVTMTRLFRRSRLECSGKGAAYYGPGITVVCIELNLLYIPGHFAITVHEGAIACRGRLFPLSTQSWINDRYHHVERGNNNRYLSVSRRVRNPRFNLVPTSPFSTTDSKGSVPGERPHIRIVVHVRFHWTRLP